MAVYNTEAYLHEAIDSVVRQTYDDWQLICVDDQSTDGSFSILKDYASKDVRINILRCAVNGGPSKARNLGLSIAKGDYIMMLDSDDWLADDALKRIIDAYEEHPDTDIFLMDQWYVFTDGKEKGYDWHYDRTKYIARPDGSFECISGKDAFILSLSWAIHGVYVAKRRLYDEYGYDETCKYFSDDNLTRIHYFIANELRCCQAKYYYRILPGSISRKVSFGRLDYLKANLSMKIQLINIGVDEDILNLYEYERWKVVVDTYMFYYVNRSSFTKADRKQCLQAIKEAWRTIETWRIDQRKLLKLGYVPFHLKWMPEGLCWWLFVIDEEIYFSLKVLLRRM